jgi:nucleoid-associated protein YgaU
MRRESYVTRLKRNDDALQGVEADKFAPVYYEETVELSEEAVYLYDEGDLWGAQQAADDALASQAVLYYNVEENKRYVAILRRDTENYLSDAEDNQAYLYAPGELEDANKKYEAGVAAYQAYDLAISEDLLAEAKHDAVEAARMSAAKKRQAQTDLLMSDTEKRIAAASRLRVIGEDGEVQEAEPWDGDDYLKANPLLDPTPEKENYIAGDSGLRKFDEPADIEGDDVTEIPIESEGTQVKGDEQTADYLVIAQNLWTRGVEARNVGNYDLADEYFNQARTFIEAYEAAAVERTYTVVYREVATDCLWRIAEYDDIYSNPFLWPRIWRANKKIIQNPDLIFPGQVLVIPPEF